MKDYESYHNSKISKFFHIDKINEIYGYLFKNLSDLYKSYHSQTIATKLRRKDKDAFLAGYNSWKKS